MHERNSLQQTHPSGMGPFEKSRRETLMRDIEKRVETYGKHRAIPHSDRARQFVPFAALKGYEEMAHEREFIASPRHELTPEESRMLSEILSGISKGDSVRITYHRHRSTRTVEGPLRAKDEASRTMRVGTTDIAFEDITWIDVVSRPSANGDPA